MKKMFRLNSNIKKSVIDLSRSHRFYILMLVCVIAMFQGMSAQAGYKDTDLLFSTDFKTKNDLSGWSKGVESTWRSGQGRNGTGALYFKTNSPKQTRWVNISLPAEKIKGLIHLEAVIRGKNLVRGGNKSWFGPKVMLRFMTGKKTLYPEPLRHLGTYGWKKVELVYFLPKNTRDLKLFVGIQEATGELWLDSVKIYRCIEDNNTVKKKGDVNLEAKKIPRGNFKGAKYRGVMSGRDLSENAFKQLKKWNVNLIRFQIRAKGGSKSISTKEKYLNMIDQKIIEIDNVLKLCKKYGIKLIIDLHVGPGTIKTKVNSNILGKDTNIETLEETWRRMATHYKGNPLIYAYDILNEPIMPNKHGSSMSWQEIAERIVKVIRKIDPNTPIIVEPSAGISNFHNLKPIKAKNIIYSPHYYPPYAYTHQGIYGHWVKWSYPGYINGIYYDREQLRIALKSAIDFQKKHNVPIFVGEFSVAAWAKGSDKYMADLISLFEEYGWDWTYHAFRESQIWSVEEESTYPRKFKKSSDNPRMRVLLKALSKNKTSK